MIHKIVFGTDFSPISDRALEYVLQISSSTEASVVLLHAIEPIAGVDLEHDDHFRAFVQNLESKAKKKAEAVIQRFEEAGVQCTLRLEIDKRWHAVVTAAEEENADLIVLGSHTVREGEKVYMGTTSHKVFFATDKPLMIVPQG